MRCWLKIPALFLHNGQAVICIDNGNNKLYCRQGVPGIFLQFSERRCKILLFDLK